MGSAEPGPPRRFTIESNDRDELSEYFSERVSKVAVSPISRSHGVTMSATVVPLGKTVAFEVDIPSGARFRQREDLDGVFVFLPLSGERARWTRGRREIVCGPSAGFLGPMYEADTMDCPGHWAHQAFKLPYDQIARNLSHLLDRPIVSPLEFDPSIDLAAAPAKAIASMARLALTPVEGGAFLSTSPLAAAQFSESVTLHLLETFAHNYSGALASGTHALKPKHVKRAIEYMRTHAGNPLTLQEIAAAAGVSVRSLHYGFKKFLGESPFEHLRQIRLEAAYAELAQAPETHSVAEIARRWGFPNPGRFAQLCKRSYGHSPSEIRRRGGAGLNGN